MRKIAWLALLLAVAALPVRAQGQDDEDDGFEEREVEVRVKKGGPRGGPGRGGPQGPGDEDGPFARGRGRAMKRIFMPAEHHAHGMPDDPALKEAREKYKAAQEKLSALRPKIRDAKDADKPALRKDAKAAVGELFDAKLAMESAMLERMGKHLAQKKEKLAKRKEAREKLVQEKTDQLMGDAPSWDD